MTQLKTAEVTREPDPPASSRTGRSLIAVMLLVGAILVNVVQFRGIDASTVNFFDAIHRAGTADLLEQGHQQCARCRDRYGLHLAIQVVAPGSTVYVPDTSPHAADRYVGEEFTLRLYSLGRVERVEWVDIAPTLDFDPAPHVFASGPGGSRGAPWVLALDAPPEGLIAPGDPDEFLMQALRDGEHRDSGRPPREFVVLQWTVTREGSGYTYQDLVLETSLLPESVRQELTR